MVIWGSKPTVWDGDLEKSQSIPWLAGLVLSPPCGMATGLSVVEFLPYILSSKPTVWDGDNVMMTSTPLMLIITVPSPPCGMVTQEIEFCFIDKETRSEPTVWDGDFTFYAPHS